MTLTPTAPSRLLIAPPVVRVAVLAWNCQQQLRRSTAAADWLADCPDADVIMIGGVLGRPHGETFARRLEARGYAVHLPRERAVMDRRILVGTRIGAIAWTTTWRIRFAAHRTLLASIDIPDAGAIGVGFLHRPPRNYQPGQDGDRAAFHNEIIARSQPHTLAAEFGEGVPVLLGGPIEALEPGSPEVDSRRYSDAEVTAYRRLTGQGLTDAYRLHHPTTVEHSHTTRDHVTARIDHLFTPTDHSHLVAACRYWHEPHQLGLSQHAAISAVLHLPRTTP